MREHHFDLDSVVLSAESVAGFDAVLLATDHTAFDYQMILDNAQLIIDTRGVYREQATNVVHA
jgi:UDP-N-acetyl-D-glucosamine dehydrogenase